MFLDTSAALHTPWGNSTVRMEQGIRHGSVESLQVFSTVIDWVLADVGRRHRWQPGTFGLKGLRVDEVAFVDDIILWHGRRVVGSQGQVEADESGRWECSHVEHWGLARQAIHYYLGDLGERWSTTWVMGYNGHRCRSGSWENPLASGLLDSYRDREWWQQQQADKMGKGHPSRFFPRLSNEKKRPGQRCWMRLAPTGC